MEAILSDMSPHPAALLAFPKGQAAGAFFRLVEFKELSLLNRLKFQLPENFFIVGSGHFVYLRLFLYQIFFGQIGWLLLWSDDGFGRFFGAESFSFGYESRAFLE